MIVCRTPTVSRLIGQYHASRYWYESVQFSNITMITNPVRYLNMLSSIS
uniref:Uncharacterized protein n=1 Tax=Megaselia scalaris TaxID=36166 RepID=T1H1V4_MEGSC